MEYIKLLLNNSSEELNVIYRGWSLVKYCTYISSYFHFRKGQERLSKLIDYLIQNGANKEIICENEEIPEELLYTRLLGGGKPSVRVTAGAFEGHEQFPKNSSGPGPRSIIFKGMRIHALYSLSPNPHGNSAYNNQGQVNFYQQAANQFNLSFLGNNNTAPHHFGFTFGNIDYSAQLEGLTSYNS